MSALAKVGAGIRNAWRHYRWRWHEPGGKADSWNPVTGREKEYPGPSPTAGPATTNASTARAATQTSRRTNG